MLSKLISAVSRVGYTFVVIVVDVLVLDDTRELGAAEFLVLQEIHLLQLRHTVNQGL